MIGVAAKDAFWRAVGRCLVEFHDFGERDARRKTKEFRQTLEQDTGPTNGDLIFHEEPFYVACSLVRTELELKPYRERYEAILKKCGW